MTISCSQQIDLSVTPYYHCVNRCVRSAFLCGEDWQTSVIYKHRRGSAGKINKLKELTEQTSRRWIKGMVQAFNPAQA